MKNPKFTKVFFWEVTDYSGNIGLFERGKMIHSDTLTKKQVEEFLNRKLRVAGRYENPDIIAEPVVKFNEDPDKWYYDRIKSRGRRKFYMIVHPNTTD